MRKKILMPDFISQAAKDYFVERGYEIKIGLEDQENLLADVVDVSAILTGYGDINEKVMKRAKELKVVAKYGVGVDNIDCASASNLGIWVVNTPLANALTVSEFTLGVILSCARQIIPLDKLMKNDKWHERMNYAGQELYNKTLGIIGLGKIGALVAKKAIYGFDMKIIGYDAYADPLKLPPEVEIVDNVDDLLKRSDFVTMHVPSTAETRGMMNDEKFSLMKPTSYFINCARGDIVNEESLYKALKEGWIKGAAIDAYLKEPMVGYSPLFELENIITTPHCAFLTVEAMDKMGVHAAMGIDEVLNGKKPTWHVNSPVKLY